MWVLNFKGSSNPAPHSDFSKTLLNIVIRLWARRAPFSHRSVTARRCFPFLRLNQLTEICFYHWQEWKLNIVSISSIQDSAWKEGEFASWIIFIDHPITFHSNDIISWCYNIATILLSIPTLIPNAQFHYGCQHRNSFSPGIRYNGNAHHRNATHASFTHGRSHCLSVRLVRLLPSPRAWGWHPAPVRSMQRTVGQGDNTALLLNSLAWLRRFSCTQHPSPSRVNSKRGQHRTFA